MTPSHGVDSALVTFKGIDFGVSGDSIYFNGKAAKITTANDSVLVAMVPTLAGTGPVTITAQGKVLTAGTFVYDTSYKVTVLADSLKMPWYLTLDVGGNVYVTTYSDFGIHSISPKGIVDTLRTLPGANGITQDAAGNFYITQLQSSPGPFVLRLRPSGQLDTLASDPGLSFGQIALDANGNIYVTNDSLSTVDKITPAGVLTRIGGGFNHPSGLIVAGDGTIYVAHNSTPDYNSLNGLISRISPSGQVSVFVHLDYNDAQVGLAMDVNNNLYVTVFEQTNDLGWVSRIRPDGTQTKLISPNLLFPTGIAVGKDGTIYVVEMASQFPPTVNGGVYTLTPH